MKRKLLLLGLLTSTLLMSGCVGTISSGGGGGGGWDMNAFIRNPVVMGIIVIVAVYVAFKMQRK